jgi:capsular polysaccharide export protein
MTSLVGFEALLRGLPVVTYGQPFYAGWGLTVDHAPLERRRRRLTLDELVAGALHRYPRYVSWQAR